MGVLKARMLTWFAIPFTRGPHFGFTDLSKLWEIVKDRESSCCSPGGCKESDTTSLLINNKY